MSGVELAACPFCGSTSVEVLPKDPESEGNAWGAVQCVNFDCPTYDGVRSHGVRVWDGEDVSDERGSDAYKRAAIVRWNRRAAPMEAVAWRWRIDDAQCPTWQYGDTRPGLLPAPYLTVQALAVIPAPGKDAVAWRETIARIISIALHGHDESADQREQTIKTATDAILALIPQAEDQETVK